MEIKELRKLSSEELNKKVITTKEELFTKKMQHATGMLDKPVELKKLKKDVARMKTILKEREIAGGNE
ncbi:MAG: 50S ribosomal protein L29 [bacterium]